MHESLQPQVSARVDDLQTRLEECTYLNYVNQGAALMLLFVATVMMMMVLIKVDVDSGRLT